jgi:hypothetical protein
VEAKSEPPEWVLSPEQASRLLAVMAETGVHPPEVTNTGPAVGRRAVQDFAQEKILDRLLVYERRIESSLYRTMGEFRKQRLLRAENPPAGEVTAEEGLPRSTGILPVGSMGVPPMTAEDIHGQARPELAERDARDTHGRDAHATRPPEGGTPNESCETNPIGAGSNVGGTTNGADGEEPLRQTNPISAGSSAGGTPNGTEGQEPACETKPMSVAARKDSVPYVPIFRRRR